MQFIRKAGILKSRAYQLVNYSVYKDPFPPFTMNDLPSPKGGWKNCNDARQTKNNLILFIGVCNLLVSVVVTVKYLTWNFLPPLKPADEEDVEY